MKRIVGLDSIRFILALMVVLGHGTFIAVDDKLARSSAFWNALQIVLKVFEPVGVGAVVGFFVLSGFVIHYPYSEGKPVQLYSFYVKRILRIGLPAIFAYFICYYFFDIGMGVLWSLICEVIYYILYPLILRYIKHFNSVLIVSFLISFLVTAYTTFFGNAGYNGDFHRDGYLVTWLVGLPIWLLGVKLANDYKSFSLKAVPSFSKLCFLRATCYVLACLSSILRFHFNIPYGYTLPLLSLVVYYWLMLEILYYRDKKENYYLAYGGLMSYSVYLLHLSLLHFAEGFFGENFNTKIWIDIPVIIVVLLCSWIFYIGVEKPSHNFARSIKI